MEAHVRRRPVGSFHWRLPMSRWSLAFLVAASAVFLLHPVAPARAAQGNRSLLETRSFAGVSEPRKLAVDPTTGDILVTETGASAPHSGSIHRFGPDGQPAPFSALGTNVLDGASGGDATPQGVILTNEGEAGTETGISVAPAGSVGGSEGDIYATDAENGVVDVFAPTGAYLGQVSAGFGCGLDTSAEGALYVGDYGGTVHQFTPTAPGQLTQAGSFAAEHVCQLAAGRAASGGSVFVNEFLGRVLKFDSSSGAVDYVVSGGEDRTVAVDPTDGDVVLASEGSELVEYDASGGTEAVEVWRHSGGSRIEGIALAPDGRLFVAREGSAEVEVFGALSYPPITTVSEVVRTGGGAATMRGTVNPQGEPVEACTFEYGTTVSLGSSVPCAESSKEIGEGNTAVPVHASLTGLGEGTAYYVRLSATGEGGAEARSAETTFVLRRGVPEGASCANTAFRIGASAKLPDCRAYEIVTPPGVEDGDVTPIHAYEVNAAYDQAAAGGAALTFSSYNAFGGTEGATIASQYLATRGPEGWEDHPLTKALGLELPLYNGIPATVTEFQQFSPDLSTAWLRHYSDRLTADAPAEGYVDLYRLETADRSYRSLITSDPPQQEGETHNKFLLEFQGATADGSHAVFTAAAPLTANAPLLAANEEQQESQLYEWSEGEGLQLLSVLPSGEPARFASTAGTLNRREGVGLFQSVAGAISRDGSRVFWSTTDSSASEGPIYVRIDGKETRTVSSTAARFWGADEAGTEAIFTIGSLGSVNPETNELNTAPTATLDSYDVETGNTTAIAGEVGGVVGVSPDLSYIWFVSFESLGGGGTAGKANLYLDHEGRISFIATVAAPEGVGTPGSRTSAAIDSEFPVQRSAALSSDGRVLVFGSTASLTGYANVDRESGKADAEVYRYDAEGGSLVCISCNPGGARPTGRLVSYASESASSVPTAAMVPSWENQIHQPRSVADDGNRVIFDSFDALLPADTNGKEDVYEWEAPGTDQSCPASAGSQGCLFLLSSGDSPRDSELVEVDTDGDDVFLRTASSLVSEDKGAIDIYDASERGGFPPPAEVPAECKGEGCQSHSTATAPTAPATQTFVGPGNPTHKKRHHKRHHRHHRHHKKKRRHRRHAHKNGRKNR